MQENELDPSLLCFAAKEGNVEEMEKLVKAGADVNQTDKSEFSPILQAMWNKQLDGVKWLINKGANVNIIDLFKHAASDDYSELIDYLYTTYSDQLVNQEIVSLIKMGKLETANSMIKKGANIKLKDERGHTVVHAAAKIPGASSLLEFFLKDRGMDTEGEETNLRTPLAFAVGAFEEAVDRRKNEEIIEAIGNNIRVLVAYGANRFVAWKSAGRGTTEKMTLFDIQNRCPELIPYLETNLETEIYKCIFFKDSKSIIENVFSNSYKLTGQIEINKKYLI